MCTKNIKNSTLPFIPSEKICLPEFGHAHKAMAIATSAYQPVAGVQIVGTVQKDLSMKHREGVASTSFLLFFPSLSDHSTI